MLLGFDECVGEIGLLMDIGRHAFNQMKKETMLAYGEKKVVQNGGQEKEDGALVAAEAKGVKTMVGLIVGLQLAIALIL